MQQKIHHLSAHSKNKHQKSNITHDQNNLSKTQNATFVVSQNNSVLTVMNQQQKNIQTYLSSRQTSFNFKVQQSNICKPVYQNQGQVIVINNRKFVKSRSNKKQSPNRFKTNHNQNWIQQVQKVQVSNPYAKIKVLQNRIAELHRQKQQQILVLISQNRNIKQQLQQYKYKQKQQMSKSKENEHNKNISQIQEQYFTLHKDRIQHMNKRISYLEIALNQAEDKNKNLQKLNSSLQYEISFKKKQSNSALSVSQMKKQQVNALQNDQIIQKLSQRKEFQYFVVGTNQHSNQHIIQNNMNLMNKQQTQLQKLRSQINKIKQQNKLNLSKIIQKDETISKLQLQLKQISNTNNILKQTNEDLSCRLKLLEQQMKSQQVRIGNINHRLNAKFVESQSIDLVGMRSNKLRSISNGQSIIINQKQQNGLDRNDKVSRTNSCQDQFQSIGSIAENTPTNSPKKKTVQLDQKYANSFKQLNLCQQQRNQKKQLEVSMEESLINVFEKMQNLTNVNEKLQIQNQLLNKKLSQIVYQNQSLQNTLDMAYTAIHKKQLQLEQKYKQNNNLKNSILEENTKSMFLNSKEGESKMFDLTLSASVSQRQPIKKQCEKCNELIKTLLQFSNQLKLDEIPALLQDNLQTKEQ